MKMQQTIRDKLYNACSMLILNRGTRFCYNAMRRIFQLKPVIDTLTVQLADHCNLNCSGCSHFSPLADKLFANITQYDSDMKQLSQLVTGINRILLLGGDQEPFPERRDHIEIAGLLRIPAAAGRNGDEYRGGV